MSTITTCIVQTCRNTLSSNLPQQTEIIVQEAVAFTCGISEPTEPLQ